MVGSAHLARVSNHGPHRHPSRRRACAAPQVSDLMAKNRHCEEPTGRANARPMTGSATKQSILVCGLMDCFAPLAMTAYFIGCISSETLRMRPRIYLNFGSENTSAY